MSLLAIDETVHGNCVPFSQRFLDEHYSRVDQQFLEALYTEAASNFALTFQYEGSQ